jgi:hypothetical protein
MSYPLTYCDECGEDVDPVDTPVITGRMGGDGHERGPTQYEPGCPVHGLGPLAALGVTKDRLGSGDGSVG